MLNESQWAKITNARIKRWKTSRASFLDDAKHVIAADRFGDWLRFVKRYGIAVSKDASVPYATRVRLAGYSIILAIRAKDEADFRRMVDEEITIAAQALGVPYEGEQ